MLTIKIDAGEELEQTDYILPHGRPRERERLELLAELLDPLHRRHLRAVGATAGWRCLEVGCGTGSISRWLAERVTPSGVAVASDLNVDFADDSSMPGLQVRELNILTDPLEVGAYDLVTTRLVLHHLPAWQTALQRMVEALRPGGWLVVLEPDLLPALVTEPPALRSFWEGFLEWAETKRIDYMIGRKLAPQIAALGLEPVIGEATGAVFNGGSLWARWFELGIADMLGRQLLESETVDLDSFEAFRAAMRDPSYYTSVMDVVAVRAQKPA